MTAEAVDVDDLSETIGTIYDCAVEASLWPRAIEQISRLVQGNHGVILMIDTVQNATRFYADWNVDPEAMRIYSEKYHADNLLHPAFSRFEVDEPYNIPTAVDPEVWLQSPLYRELAAPRGWLDNLGVSILKTPTRMASLSVVLPAAAGWAGPRELKIMGLLSPHVRRAASIADLIEMRTLAAATFEQALDGLSVPVVLVDAASRIVHANPAARMLFAAGGALSSEHGILHASSSAAAQLLTAAIAQTAQPEARMGKVGIDIPLPFADGRPGCAHVLPLGPGSVRGALGGGASAAVFFAPSPEPFRPPVEAWAAAFGFTPAEIKVLDGLVRGQSVGEVARGLSVAETTVRTHVASMMSKAGVSRQVDLIRMAKDAAPPVRRG